MARLDTGWHAHPKLLKLGLAAMGLHAWSISYCDFTLSDGFIPLGACPSLPGVKQAIAKLVGDGLWTPVSGGYTVHDYTDYNRTRAQVAALHAEDRKRKRAVRAGVRPDKLRNPNGFLQDSGPPSGRIPRAPLPGPGLSPGGSGGTDPVRARAHEEPPPPPAFFDQLPDEMRARLTRPPLP